MYQMNNQVANKGNRTIAESYDRNKVQTKQLLLQGLDNV